MQQNSFRNTKALLTCGGLTEVLETIDQSDGYTPLGFAVSMGHEKVGQALLKAARCARLLPGHSS